jgi:hypothetical protein
MSNLPGNTTVLTQATIKGHIIRLCLEWNLASGIANYVADISPGNDAVPPEAFKSRNFRAVSKWYTYNVNILLKL